MKYKLILTEYGQETETVNDEYSIKVFLRLEHTEGAMSGSSFIKDLLITSHNSQTGFEVDAQRAKAIEDFCTENDIEVSE